jgi:ribonuclease HII
MPDWSFESRYHGPVAGVDEAGRGPLAGPVVAAAVILDSAHIPDGLADSKKLSATKREHLFEQLNTCAHVGIGEATVEEIDRVNILQATMLAMTRAVAALGHCPVHVLVDGNRLPRWDWAATAIVKGDDRCLSIAAASIIAKVHRDRIMTRLDEDYPGYGWGRNAGYGTADHLAGLQRHGVTPHHRRSFAPVRNLL